MSAANSIPNRGRYHNFISKLMCIHSIVNLETPSRSVDDYAHQAPGDDTSDGEGNEPAKIDPCDHTPVDSSPGTRTETDSNGST